ncbi:MAG: hypothetical protein ABIU05_00440 [Nitrospirales bacterium]
MRIWYAPRFVLEMDRECSLFPKMNISYEEFAKLPPESKMNHIRKYSRGRLKPRERLCWLEMRSVKVFHSRSALQEAVQGGKANIASGRGYIVPSVVGGSRQKDKYNDVAFFLKYHNVFCPQTRDLFSAGSVTGKERRGRYIAKALKDIENEMRHAASSLEDDLFEDYRGNKVPAEDRIAEWLGEADAFATSWKPSESLFISG